MVIVALLLAMFLLTSTSAWAGGVNRIGGVGPRDIAMGGAGTATANDVAIFYRNPSLLAQTPTPSFVQVGTDYIQADFDYTSPLGRHYDSETGKYFVPFLGTNYKPTDRLAVGLGILTPDVFGAKFKNTLSFESKISMTEIAPTIAYRPWDNFSLGASLKISYGQIQLTQPIAMDGKNIGQLNTKADGWGYGAQFGASWQPLNWLSLGISYQTKTKISLSGKTDQSTLLGTSATNLDTEFYFPGRYMLGAGLKLGDLTLAADIIRFDYSSTDKVIIRYQNGSRQTLKLDWKDNWYYGLGAEYRLTKKWALRAGAAYQTAVVPDSTINPSTPDMNGWSLSAGFGFQPTEHWGIDIAYLHAWGLGRTVSPPNSGAGEYKAGIDIFSAAVSYRF